MLSAGWWTRNGHAGPTVLSLNVQAGMEGTARVRGPFEVLVRHLFDRMLNNEAFGEDAAARATQLVYAIGLPGVLVALFLFPAYHQPAMGHVRTYWSQAADHLFYVTYAMVTLGVAMVFQWELLFPDLLDMYVLSSLPIRGARLSLGRAAALALFLGLVLVGTSGPGSVFFPGVADLRTGFWRHLAAHVLTLSMGSAATVFALIALQALLTCLPGRRLPDALSAAARAGVVLALLTVFFLFPLTAHFLRELLYGGGLAGRVFPPFWFLGVYECLLWGGAAEPVFHDLARMAVMVTAGLGALAALLYPLAHARRLRRLVEGPALVGERARPVRALLERVLHAVVVRHPGERAIFHFGTQTLLRLTRLQLYLAMYAGLGLALLVSGLLAFAIEGGRMRPVVARSGVPMAVPVLAFWTVAGLRTALAAPLGRQGSWIFRVTMANGWNQELHGAELLVRVTAVLVTLLGVAVLRAIAPGVLTGVLPVGAQLVLAVGLSVILTDLFFLPARALPFTAARGTATREMPLRLVLYFVVFPAFVLWVAEQEPWVASSHGHLLLTAVGLGAIHVGLRRVRLAILRRSEPPEDLLFTGLGLRD